MDWKKQLEQQQTQMQGTVAGNEQKPKTDVMSTVNPSGITQSYYTTPTNSKNYEKGRPTYVQSEAVQNAANALKTHQEQNKPGAYQGTWDDQIQSMINSALMQPNFNYSAQMDPTYQVYEDRAKTQGRMAMKGAVGEGAAATGGYANTYAQQMGQEAYQQQMQQLNDMIPTLRDQAYQRYQDENARRQQTIDMLQTDEDRKYGMYRDDVSDYQQDLNYLYTMFSDMSQQEYERYTNDRAAWEADRAYWYQKAYDKQQQRNWEKMFAAQHG